MDTILAHWPTDVLVPLLRPQPVDLVDLQRRLAHNNTAYLLVHHPELLQAHVSPVPGIASPPTPEVH